MPCKALCLHADDDVATVLSDVAMGDRVVVTDRAGNCVCDLVSRDSIGIFHKIALHHIDVGAVVHKYGDAIGRATEDILPGGHVHVHNLESIRTRKHD
ncbi:hypothetical protein HMPREF1008_01854 [Olsenella sp. oral taxon 809 str. F0356]|uniref:UxaA family hydrolase n=1 Tax=Olsenella sp. oral taxon 809 TaxID=661086 RepID=UPI000231F39D|nr:UxaA family hydrolase [Olsenella sp. oral taxon 809]EHF01374.1 hypothetical protein HMPREF1008_01854 [Olsenella sp. oral taxon 809 str. F0356]